MYTQEITVNNEVGLHARPATFFIQKANEFKSGIWVEKDDRRVNAKSLLGVLSLGIVKGTKITLTAHSHSELYMQDTLNEKDYEPVMYTPETVQTQHAGSKGELMGAMEREIKTFFDYDNAPFSNMVLGEVLNRPGKWSSYPPHHHPQPEVYFYRFDYPHGFGAGFANGDVYKTEQNGCAVINHGFHSQVVAPGYAMCYAWGIRHLEGDPWLKTRIDDKEHEWLWKPDANDHIYPNH